MRGIVKWWNESKGYGFLRLENSEDQRDIFIHFTAFKGNSALNLIEGEIIYFDLVDGKNGPQAINASKEFKLTCSF